MSDNVEHPSHYNTGSVETIDAIKSALGDAFLDYCRGNVLKYVWRCRHKNNTLEDLRKAAKYLEWAIAEAESEKPNKPQPLAIPEGWRELQNGEELSKADLYECGGKWNPYTDSNPAGSDFPYYIKSIHYRHIRKIETEKPEHVEGVWVEEADANASKIEPTETSDASIPDPGPGYRLLSKDPPEPVVEGDDFWCDTYWEESDNWRSGGRQCSSYYRRKIEPTEWFPKVGDKVRVVKTNMLATGRVGVVSKFDGKTCSVRIESEGLTSFGLEAKDVELVEEAS